jgi:hypothetical protein
MLKVFTIQVKNQRPLITISLQKLLKEGLEPVDQEVELKKEMLEVVDICPLVSIKRQMKVKTTVKRLMKFLDKYRWLLTK